MPGRRTEEWEWCDTGADREQRGRAGVPGPDCAHLPPVQPGAEHGAQPQGHLPRVPVRGAPGHSGVCGEHEGPVAQ